MTNAAAAKRKRQARWQRTTISKLEDGRYCKGGDLRYGVLLNSSVSMYRLVRESPLSCVSREGSSVYGDPQYFYFMKKRMCGWLQVSSTQVYEVDELQNQLEATKKSSGSEYAVMGVE